MPVKNTPNQSRVSTSLFTMPRVQPGDDIIGCINAEWRDPCPGVCLEVSTTNSITMQLWHPRYGQLILAGCVHRTDPEITLHPDRFGGNDSGIWELAPKTQRIYDLATRVEKLEARVAALDARVQQKELRAAAPPPRPATPAWLSSDEMTGLQEPVSA